MSRPADAKLAERFHCFKGIYLCKNRRGQGTCRVETTLARDKLAGKWSSLDGSESGTIAAERMKS